MAVVSFAATGTFSFFFCALAVVIIIRNASAQKKKEKEHDKHFNQLKIEYTGISNKVFKGLINEVQKLNS
jgi:preprotein translocase subunit YajC